MDGEALTAAIVLELDAVHRNILRNPPVAVSHFHNYLTFTKPNHPV